MTGLGTIVNCAAVIVGAVVGMVFKKVLKERFCELITQCMGLTVIFIGGAGGIGRIIELNKQENGTAQIVFMVIAFALGSFVGELINIQHLTERFGAWLRKKSGSEGDNSFISGFVTASLTICVGAMAVIGPIQDALNHDYSTLFTKAVLDLVIIAVMASAMGKGTVFFRNSACRSARLNNASGKICQASSDRSCHFEYQLCRLNDDFCCRRQSDV